MWVLALISALAAPCERAATVDGTDERVAEVRHDLAILGIAADDGGEGCQPATVRLEASGDGGLVVRLDRHDHLVSQRVVPSADAAAAWIESVVREDRYTDLLDPEAAPATGIRLYATAADFVAGNSSATLETLPWVPEDVADRLMGPEMFEQLYVPDIPLKQARPTGRAFAVVDGDTTYVNDGTPFPHKGIEYGRLEVIGNTGVFQRRECRWVQAGSGGFMVCELSVRTVDMTTGEVARITKKGLRQALEATPDLLRAYNGEPRKHPGVLRKYLTRMLHASQ
jgi:hypothetical protein